MTKTDRPHPHQPRTISRLLVPLLTSDWVALLGLAWRIGRQIISRKAHEGMYEVLDYESRLELLDPGGQLAILTKHQQVRFLQDGILAYNDKAWGDGEIFADYQCSPGMAVDRYREGHRWYILISLRKTMNRGDSETFHIQRTIRDGFTKRVEDFQTEIDHTTRQVSLTLVFPRQRPPRQVFLIEQNTTHTIALGPEHRQVLPDGRHQIAWSTDKPRLFEAYILHWEW